MRIKVRLKDDSIEVSCSKNGKRVDMTIPSNISNIAGVLAEVSTKMIKYNNQKKGCNMIDQEIKEQLDRIEQYAMIAAKSMLNIKEAAIILGMTVEGLRYNVRNNILPYYKPNVNRLYFKKSELEDWMMQNRSKSMAEIESEAAAYCTTH